MMYLWSYVGLPILQVDELPLLLVRAKQLEKLRETISQLDMFSRMAATEETRFSLISAWKTVRTKQSYLVPFKPLAPKLAISTLIISLKKIFLKVYEGICCANSPIHNSSLSISGIYKYQYKVISCCFIGQ